MPLGIYALYYLLFYFCTRTVMVIPNFSVGARRLHNIGKTGWWQLLNFLPFGSIVLLVFFIIESEEKENKYGPNPHSEFKQAIGY
ncbi:aminopeptidase [Bacillus thuringiensis serovar navarrensis]|uniref:Aminopeptidase n=1 Tax=Bacillus thuringiensis serovar navarrensis TaxID=339658 RepID=A0A243AJJ1_BACTU|nr:aminopeptidase [Bacillus thuringiensis serovar navarrensis]